MPAEATINLVLAAMVRQLEKIGDDPGVYWTRPAVRQQLPVSLNDVAPPVLIVTAPDYATNVRLLGGDIVDAGPFDVQVWGIAEGTIEGDGERNCHRLMRDVVRCLSADRTFGGAISSGVGLPTGYHFDMELSGQISTAVAVMTVKVNWEHDKASP